MKKLNRRAFSVLLIAAFIMMGLCTYVTRFLRDGESWASYFSRLNSLSEGLVTDRNGVLLASFTANDNHYMRAGFAQRPHRPEAEPSTAPSLGQPGPDLPGLQWYCHTKG